MVKQTRSLPKFFLSIVLFVYLVLGVVYVLVTPAFEASDEYKHYPVVHHIQNTGKLVVLDPSVRERWQQEGAQPPLYYIIMAAVTYPLDTSDLPDVYEENSFAFIGNPNQIHNKNLMLHNPSDYAFPNTGSIRAVYLIRFASLFIGFGTIMVAWKIGLLLRDERTALLAATLTAFQPMFLFTNAAVNNDSLANLLGASGLYLLLKYYKALTQEITTTENTENTEKETLAHQAQSPHVSGKSLRDPAVGNPETQVGHHKRFIKFGLPLAIILGLGMLTKLSIMGLLLLTGIVVALEAWKQKKPWILFGEGLAIFLLAMTIVSPMIVRNMTLYGWDDPTAVNVFVEVQGVRSEPLTLRGFVGEFGTFYRNYWGQFGGINIPMPEWLYNAYNLMFFVAVIGLFRAKIRWREGWWIILAWVSVILALLLRWTFIYYSFQGRLVFPALAGINVILAAGLLSFRNQLSVIGHPNNNRLRMTDYGLPALLVISALWLAVGQIRPNYKWPQPLTTVPPSAQIDPIRFVADDGIVELVGMEFAEGQSVLPGGREAIDVTLYWQSPEPPTNNYLSAINVLGRDLEVVGRVNRHPASGMIAVSDWEPTQIWQDEYKVWVSRDAEPLAKLKVVVDMYDPEAGEALAAFSADGTPIEFNTIGNARLGATRQIEPVPDVTLDAEFGEGITLIGYDMPSELHVGASIPLTLTWQASATPAQDYTVFVQLLDAGNQLLGSGDAEPVNNGEYPTSYWRDGDVVVDARAIMLQPDVPAGNYRVAVGLYDRVTGVRVPLVNGGDAVIWDVSLAP